MTSLKDYNKDFKRNNTNSSQSLQENGRGTFPNSFYEASVTLTQKPDKIWKNKNKNKNKIKKLQPNIPHKYR